MADEEKTRERLEIAHVLFIDIVGYSQRLVDEQSEALHELNVQVRATEAVRTAEAADRLIRLPTGDGMALVFTSSVEAPVECALELSRALSGRPDLPLRMGVHSGAVQHVKDVNGRENIAGSGINVAQRVMDCGDAGHILVSRRVADDLAGSRRWQPYLHPLGDVEVKHGLVLELVNFHGNAVGNPMSPRRLSTAWRSGPGAGRRWLAAAALALVAVAVTAGVGWWWLGRSHGERNTPLSPATADNPATTPLSTTEPELPAPEKSVAVLPFANLSADQDNAYFADGVQDEILTHLAKIADLKVISRTSVMPYKGAHQKQLREIGRQLGVSHVLEGSVQRAGNKARITAQLIDTRTDAHLWAEHYDRPLDDVFAVQSEIAEAIAAQLKVKLSAQEKSALDAPPTTDLAAYDLYLRARNLYTDTSDVVRAAEKLPEAVRLLRQALDRDPAFLLAWCLLARTHSSIYWQGIEHTPERLEAVRTAVEAAARLQPDAGETHLAWADYYYRGFRDYERARVELDLARRTLPNSAEIFEWSSYIDRRQGRWGESERNMNRALELDPRDFFKLQQLAVTDYAYQKRYDDQVRIFNRALSVVPGDPITRMCLAVVALDRGADIRPFQATLATLLAESPGLPPGDIDDPPTSLCERTPAAATRALSHYPREGTFNNGTNYPYAYWEGVIARWQGDAPRARAAFTTARAEVEKTVVAQPDLAAAVSLLGIIDAALGNREQAVAGGRRACALLPTTRDAIDGPVLATNLAQIYAWTGDRAAAVEQIAAVQRAPNLLSYGQLKLSPLWDDLRGDPGFEALVASLAPKS